MALASIGPSTDTFPLILTTHKHPPPQVYAHPTLLSSLSSQPNYTVVLLYHDLKLSSEGLEGLLDDVPRELEVDACSHTSIDREAVTKR